MSYWILAISLYVYDGALDVAPANIALDTVEFAEEKDCRAMLEQYKNRHNSLYVKTKGFCYEVAEDE